MKSIRRNLTLTLFASLTLLIAAGSAGLFVLLRTILIHDENSTLVSKAHALATLVHRRPNGSIELEFSDDFMREFQGGRDVEYFQIWLGDKLLARSRSLRTNDLPKRSVSYKNPPRFFDLKLPDGRLGRAAALGFLPKPDPEEYEEAHLPLPPPDPKLRATVVVARGSETMDRLLFLLAVSLIAISVTVPLGIALIVRWVVRRGLVPLAGVATAASGVSANSLDFRYDTQAMPEELQPICLRLNDLLERLEGAFERQRRFSGDVAHELRTPIAELRTLTEVALMEESGVEGDDVARQTLRETLEVSAKMERMVGTLLMLARADAGRQPIALQSVDLASALRDVWAAHAGRAHQRGLSLDWKVPETPLPVRTVPTMLQSIVDNLLTNAVEYAPEGGHIRIEAASAGGAATLCIANANPGLNPEEIPRLAEPFWRKDPSRTDETHSGLGLALVSALCKSLRTPMKIEIDAAGDFSVALQLERAAPEQAD